MKLIKRTSGIVFLISFVLLSNLVLTGCSTTKKQSMNKAITITGIAQNAKLGAVVCTADNEVYYIEGKSSWPEELLNASITVSGTLYSVEHKAEDLVNEKGEYSQGMVGTQKIIKNADIRKN
jgi:hypothetical protein